MMTGVGIGCHEVGTGPPVGDGVGYLVGNLGVGVGYLVGGLGDGVGYRVGVGVGFRVGVGTIAVVVLQH